MRCLRVAFLCGLLAAIGCDSAAPAPAVAPEAPSPPPPVADPVPGAPKKEPEVAEPTGGGGAECATGEACAAEASAQERAGHLDKAAPLYDRACALGVPQACHRVGELYRDGKGVAADDARARELFERGCRDGSNAACDALGH